MKKLVYVWKNCGLMRLGYDIETIKVEIASKSTMTITIDTGQIEIKDKLFAFLNQVDCQKIISKLENVKFPQEEKYNSDGCDGAAWQLQVDDKKYEGYLTEPDFLKEVLDIINFRVIYAYAKSKVANYLK